ncbi:hypothetical protein J6590_092818 [Homalodisca vitripennis]|nr:hypothetical protein J6590_092818 [Homalodisca vitripennis]
MGFANENTSYMQVLPLYQEELRFSTGPCRRGFKTRTDQRAGRNASPDTSLTDQLIAGPTEQKMSTHRV